MFGLSIKEKMLKALKTEFPGVSGIVVCFDKDMQQVSNEQLAFVADQGNSIIIFDNEGNQRIRLPFIFKREFSLKTASGVKADSAAVKFECAEGFSVIKMAKADHSIVYAVLFPDWDGRTMTITVERAFK